MAGGFLRSPRLDAEGVNLTFQQIGDRRIDQAMTLHRGLVAESGGNDINAEMTTAAGAGVADVGRALVADLQLRRRQRGAQPLFDPGDALVHNDDGRVWRKG